MVWCSMLAENCCAGGTLCVKKNPVQRPSLPGVFVAQWLAVADVGEGPGPPLFWQKKIIIVLEKRRRKKSRQGKRYSQIIFVSTYQKKRPPPQLKVWIRHWLEHSTGVKEVVDSIRSWNSDTLFCSSFTRYQATTSVKQLLFIFVKSKGTTLKCHPSYFFKMKRISVKFTLSKGLKFIWLEILLKTLRSFRFL